MNTTIIIAIASFLWYRKGRLWNFYDGIVSKSTEQMQLNSLDYNGWEEIALEQSDLTSKDLFQSLFRFEAEYLRSKIIDLKDKLPIPDSETSNGEIIEYKDKVKYCKHLIKEQYYPDFRCCGFFRACQQKCVNRNWS